MVCRMSPDGVVLVGRDGRAVWCNPALRALSGSAADHERVVAAVVGATRAGTGSHRCAIPTERGLLDRDVTVAQLGDDLLVATFAIDTVTQDEHTSRLEAMLEHTDDLITLVAGDGTIRASNAAAGRLTGLSGAGVNGRNAMDFVHPDDVDAASAALAEVLASPGATARVETRVRFADGRWHDVDSAVTNLLEDPKVASLVISMHDVTDRRLAEQQVARSEAMLRSLVENLTDVIVVLDERFEVTWSSPGIEAIIDAPAASNVGMSAFNDVHPDDLEMVQSTLTRLVASPLGERARVDLRLEARPRSDRWRWIEATVVNRLEDPHVRGLVVTLRDVTDTKAAAAELQEAFDRLQELDTLKDQFLASVSHEMRTPLAVIIGFADLLLRDDVATSVRSSAIDRIRSSAAEMRSMVENLLDFSALEAGKLPVSLRPVSVGRCLESALTAVSALVGEHPIVIEVADDLRVVADPEGLDRMLRNLLANAARYSERGRPITITAAPSAPSAPSASSVTPDGPADAETVTIDVRDEGIGIAEDQQSLVFERLYRGPGAAFVSRGTGVGLNMVKRYAELMGGTVSVRSVVGQGSTFTVRLPAASSAS
jgi:PAS domain S-box-containing protein